MSTQPSRTSLGGASMRGRETAPALRAPGSSATGIASPDLVRSLAEVKGQAQFLLYLADQIEESLEQLANESDSCHGAFLCKILGMYSSQLETRHQGLGDKIAETCQEVYVTVREYDIA
ncbi:MAG TPA: hypothetical protein VKP69_04970 [Isosphaeraceae bacterium]|nr:hypothetical protein [Isosphaeraceae bacterium]